MSVADLGFAVPQGFLSGVNNYCPRLIGLAQMSLDHEKMMDFGSPVAASATGILNAAAVGVTLTPADFLSTGDLVSGKIVSAKWGRGISIVASGAATNAFTLIGRDYLGQPVKKTGVLNGTTPVVPGVALKWLDSLNVVTGGGVTINVGYTNALGCEYRVAMILHEFADLARVNPGTLTTGTPDLTDPATATTLDPRGLYTPTTTPNGVIELSVKYLVMPYVNALTNGGAHGIRHFGG